MQSEYQELFRISAPGIQKKTGKFLQGKEKGKEIQQFVMGLGKKLKKNQEALQNVDLNLDTLLYLKETMQERLIKLNQTLSFDKEAEKNTQNLTLLQKKYENDLKTTSQTLIDRSNSLTSLTNNKKFLTSELETLKSHFISCLEHENELKESISQLKVLTIRSLKEQNVLLRMNGEKEIQQIESGYSVLTPATTHKLKLALNLTQQSDTQFIWVFLLFVFTIFVIKYSNFSI